MVLSVNMNKEVIVSSSDSFVFTCEQAFINVFSGAFSRDKISVIKDGDLFYYMTSLAPVQVKSYYSGFKS